MTLDPALNFILNSSEDKVIQDIELLNHEKKEILSDPQFNSTEKQISPRL